MFKAYSVETLRTWTEISVSETFLTARALKPVQEYGRLATVTMEIKELYRITMQLNWLLSAPMQVSISS